MRECNKSEITVEKLMNIVHNYTDPIRILVVMGDAWLTCDEAKRMHSFVTDENYEYRLEDKVYKASGKRWTKDHRPWLYSCEIERE